MAEQPVSDYTRIRQLEAALGELVLVLREYGSFPPKVLPALQAAERTLGVPIPDQGKGEREA